MTMRTATLLLLCLPVLGCGGSAPDPEPDTAETAGAGDAAVNDTAAGTVTVDAGMLRDLRITTRAVESRPGGEQIVLLGETAVDERTYAEVGVPIAARVTRLLVNEGDTVRAGQVLAELTSPDLGHARAEYLSAQARVALADASLERARGLAAERIVPQREVEAAQSEAAAARAMQRSAQTAVETFGVDAAGGDTTSVFTLRAAVGGTVIERRALVGQMLDPAEPAFRIGNLSALWLTVHAFERDAVRVERGTTARLAFPALPGRDFSGVVTVVGREVERESRTVPVRLEVENRDGVLRPGMSAVASMPVGASGTPILTVPVAAVQRVRDEWCVFLPGSDDATFQIRRIGRGRDLAGEVEVLSGVSAGETIVVDGAFLLKAQAERGSGSSDEHAH